MEKAICNYEKNHPGESETRTKKLLANTLFEILEKTDFAKISVNDICIKAGISRATFYMYFEDKYDLTKFAFGQMSKKIFEDSPSKNEESIINQSIKTISQHKESIRNLIFGNSTDLTDVTADYFAKYFLMELQRLEENGYKFKMDIEPIAVIMSGGIGLIISWWISNNKVNEEELGKIILDYYENMIKHYKI